MILNENVEFVLADGGVKGAFNGTPEKVLLQRGVKLYRRTERPLNGKDGISSWWCFVDDTRLPGGAMANGLNTTRMFAKRLGTSHREYLTVRAAVGEGFKNSMMHLLVIELRTPVWGFAGVAMGQREFERKELDHIFLIGGEHQLWLPGLTNVHVFEIQKAM
jgi:hypothetical protein